jgi:homoserine O-succinyltransferase/O-acetyltransferase
MLIADTLPSVSFSADEPIVIGLVNNMPDPALRTTERQFHRLIAEASGSRIVHVRHFMLPGVSRGAAASLYVNQSCESAASLWFAKIDGLIVTGTEPRAARLSDEPYWNALTRLIDWAGGHTISTIWSCLAAHAVALHLDGVERRKLPAKLSGVFDCIGVESHPVIAGLPARWRMPHSRYNDLPAEFLVERGYQILCGSERAGAAVFIKARSGLDIFFQGHPEYEADTLLREYRRDVRRFLKGEITNYPPMPASYFGPDATSALDAFRQEAMRRRDAGLIRDFPNVAISDQIANSWRSAAVRIYTNWIDYLAECKQQQRRRAIA